MTFYDLPKHEREKLSHNIQIALLKDVKYNQNIHFLKYFSDEDTYIRKCAYLAVGKLYKLDNSIQNPLVFILTNLVSNPNFHIRQTAINAAGEIGILNFTCIQNLMDIGLFDPHHTVRNAVIGSIKKMGEKNPVPVLAWAKLYLNHPDQEIRREICHGIELRGRKYPQDILPLLKTLQFDETKRVRKTLVHVIGQIAYKKGCLPIVTDELNTWENKLLVKQAKLEIIDVHERYKNFAHLSQQQAIDYLKQYAHDED
jgi:HEAT repeat protein